MRPNPFPALLRSVRRDVDARMRGFFDAQVAVSTDFGTPVAEITEAVEELCLRGGKRLRAALVVAGYKSAAPNADLDPALDAGVALELLHGYFLVHDDWMDQDAIRRGGPAVHAALARRYGSVHLGAAAAILGGDLLVALAGDMISKLEVPARRLPPILAAFSEMQIHAVAGQQLDLVSDDRDAERMYELKTGSYTVRGPLVVGAHLAGGSRRLVAALERFAMPVGVAFQHRDDLIGTFGDPAETGKPFASDLKAGKRTLLYLHGLEKAKGADKKALTAAWGNPKATKKQLERAVAALEGVGARAEIEARIDALVQTGLEALESKALSTTGRDLLRGAAEALAYRRT
jgi:geranylgeranyl diphosphate synthase type I